jgi:polyferredoxin
VKDQRLLGRTHLPKFAYIFAGLLILLGLLWMGQGSGYFPYPAESFMIDQTPWVYWGAIAAAAGVILFVVTRNGRGRSQ